MNAASILGACVTGALQSLLLVAVVAGVLRITRQADATTRHRVWFLVLLAGVALPLIDLAAAMPSPHPAAASAPHGAPALAFFVVPREALAIALIVWATVSGTFLLRLAWSFARLEWLRRRTVPVSPALEEKVRAWATQMGIRRSVAVRSSITLSSPIAIGLHRPLIVIPSRLLATLDEADLDYICVHELAHLRRRDDLTNLLAKTFRALFAFNPALIFVERRMAVEREIACDDWVVGTLGRARRYARCLAQVLLLSPPHAKAHGYLTFFRSPAHSVRRIEMLLAPQAQGRVFRLPLRPENALLGAAVAAIALGLGFAAAAPPLVGFASPLLRFAPVARLDALRAALLGDVVPATIPARTTIASFDAAVHAPAFGVAYRINPVRVTISPPASTGSFTVAVGTASGASPTVDAEPARAGLLARDSDAAADVAEAVVPQTVRTIAAHFGVGTPIVPPRTPAIALSYNTIVLAPATSAGAAGAAGATGVAGGSGSTGSSGSITLPGGTIAAPPTTVTGRGELPGSRH